MVRLTGVIPHPDDDVCVDRFYSGGDGGYAYGEEGRLLDVTGVPDAGISIRVDTRPVRAAKLAGIHQHRTELVEHERIRDPLRWIHLDSGCLVQAKPPKRAGDPVRADLFEGLPRIETRAARGR